MDEQPADESGISSAESVAARLGEVIHGLLSKSSSSVLEITERHGLTLTQVKILMTLALSDAPLAVHELAAANGISLPTAGRAVDHLVGVKLVSRREDTADRRVKRASLTAKGLETTGRVAAERTRLLAETLNELTEAELADLNAALKPLAERVREKTRTER